MNRMVKGTLMVRLGLVALFMVLSVIGRLAPASRPPADTSPPTHVASLVGSWRGSWQEIHPSRLVVERINPDDRRATIVYTTRDNGSAGPRDAIARVRARIEHGTLAWSFAGSHTFWLSEDGERLLGTRTYMGKHARVSMTRREPSRAPEMPGLSPELTSLLGTWHGTWEEIFPSTLMVRPAGRLRVGRPFAD